MSARDLWQQVAANFDPARPPEPNWLVERTGSPSSRITRRLSRPSGLGVSRIMLHGTVGTGKTTELRRIAGALANEDLVVFLDIEGYFDELGDKAALQKVSSWEVCFMAAMGLVARAQEQLGMEFEPRRLQAISAAWEKLAKETGSTPTPSLDVAALSKGLLNTTALVLSPFAAESPVVAAALGGVSASATAFDSIKNWLFPAGKSTKAISDQTPEVQNLVAATNGLISDVQKQKRVVFILDGLDRIQSRQHAIELFVESQILLKLIAPVVVTAPFILRHDILAGGVEGWRPEFLVNEPVIEEHTPELAGPGVVVFQALFDRRMSSIGPGLLSVPQIHQLARYSGGRARQFVQLIREVAFRAYDDDITQATDTLISSVIDEARRTRERGLNAGHIAVLEKVMSDPRRLMPESPLTPELLNTFALLPYPNESEWFYPHPLLTLHLLRPGSTVLELLLRLSRARCSSGCKTPRLSSSVRWCGGCAGSLRESLSSEMRGPSTASRLAALSS